MPSSANSCLTYSEGFQVCVDFCMGCGDLSGGIGTFCLPFQGAAGGAADGVTVVVDDIGMSGDGGIECSSTSPDSLASFSGILGDGGNGICSGNIDPNEDMVCGAAC
jgi:hypothetical protein